MAFASNILDRLLEPFFGWNIAGTYQSASQFIDFVLYLIFFISVTRFALAKRFDAKTQRPITIMLGIALAIGMSFFGMRWGFSIGDLAPLAGLLFLFVLGMMFFKLIKDMGDSAPGAGAFAFLLIFFSMTAIVPSFYSWIIQKVPFLEALLSIGVILAVFIAVKEMFGLITGGGGAKADGDMGLSDSQEYLKKKEKKKREIVEKGVERLRQEADEVREKAAVAKTPEEKKAYKKKADDNRAKADEKLEDELTSRGSIGGIPVRSRLSSAELIKRRKEYLKRLEDLEKEKLEEIETIKKELIEFQEKLEQMNLRNYEDLSDGNKEIYIDIGRNIQNKLLKLVNTLFKLEKCEIKDLEFLKKLRYNVDTRQISRFYLNIIGNEEMIKKEYNLVMLVKRFSEKIVKIMEEQNKIPHLPGLISRIIQVVDKLKEINEESLSRL